MTTLDPNAAFLANLIQQLELMMQRDHNTAWLRLEFPGGGFIQALPKQGRIMVDLPEQPCFVAAFKDPHEQPFATSYRTSEGLLVHTQICDSTTEAADLMIFAATQVLGVLELEAGTFHTESPRATVAQ